MDKNVQWTLFTCFTIPLNIVQLSQAHCKCNSSQRTLFWCHFNSPYLLRPDLIEGEFGNQKKEMESELYQKQANKWSNSDVSLLIELLEERAYLWDVHDKSNHLKDVRERALNEMSECLDASPADIKTKILTLRSQLGREITKVNRTKSVQSTDQLYKSTWIYWGSLQFLRPVLQPGKSRDSLKGPLIDTETENPDLENKSEGDYSKSASRETSTPKLKKEAL